MVSKPSPNNHKENGHEENRQKGCGKHSPHNARTDGVLRAAPGPGADHQRHDAKNKGQGRHQDRSKAHPGSFQRGFNNAFAFFIHQVFSKFDDQDGVFRR